MALTNAEKQQGFREKQKLSNRDEFMIDTVNYDGVKYPGEVTTIGDQDDFRVPESCLKLDKPKIANCHRQYKFPSKI